jgi:hypothetical protein
VLRTEAEVATLRLTLKWLSHRQVSNLQPLKLGNRIKQTEVQHLHQPPPRMQNAQAHLSDPLAGLKGPKNAQWLSSGIATSPTQTTTRKMHYRGGNAGLGRFSLASDNERWMILFTFGVLLACLESGVLGSLHKVGVSFG